jgi:hypothetical protein
MALDECSGIARAPSFSAPPRGLISRLDVVLNRPLLIGLVAVLASLFCCSALAQNDAVLEVKPAPVAIPTRPAHHPSPARPEGVPLLFLAMLGLAGLALSQTRGASPSEHRDTAFRAGKNVARGQELPQARRPTEPALVPALESVRAGEHHHDIVGLESVA